MSTSQAPRPSEGGGVNTPGKVYSLWKSGGAKRISMATALSAMTKTRPSSSILGIVFILHRLAPYPR